MFECCDCVCVIGTVVPLSGGKNKTLFIFLAIDEQHLCQILMIHPRQAPCGFLLAMTREQLVKEPKVQEKCMGGKLRIGKCNPLT